MKKLLIILLALSMMIFALTACDGGESEGAGEEEKNEGSLIWDFDADVYLITDKSGDWRVDFVDRFTRGTGGITLISSSADKAKRDHEIVVGRSGREVSRLAYEALSAGMTSDEDAEGYLVYAYDGSLSIAYSSDAAFKHSVEAFLSNCLTPEMIVEDGVILSDFYSLTERAEENRQKMYDRYIEKIKSELTESGATNSAMIAEKIEKLYSLYGTDMLIWLANLYDIERGGFYYSNSGRDNFGYFPDLESTGQAFAMLDRSGLYKDFGGLYNHGIPDFMHDSLLSFVRGLQSSEDGFFYHPQWGTAIASSRRSRDLDNAVSLLGYLREQPYYDEPSDRREGLYGAPGENAVKPTAYLTSPLGASPDFSAVCPTASNLPYYLQSLEAWEHYLRVERPITKDSYSVGNTLASDWALIKAAGPEYVEYVINYLNETQIPETGLWEWNTNDVDYDPTDGIGFNGTNGLMKICVLYGSLGYSVPNAYNALQSAIKVGLYRNDPNKNETVCYVLNIWTCLNSMMSSINKNDHDDYEAARALLIENAPALIDASYDILSSHLMEDGGFCYFEHSPMNISQGALVGCAEWLESDINATMVATSSTVGAMFGALELSGMPIWCPDDYYVFMDEFTSLTPIVKNPKYGMETFDGEIDGDLISLDLGEGDTYAVTDGALRIVTSEAAPFGAVNVTMRNSNDIGKCHFLESDFKIDSAEVGEILLFNFKSTGATLSSLTLECYLDGGEKKLRIKDTYAGADGEMKIIIDSLDLGEWHRLRMITYKIYGTSGYSVRSKVMVNDKYVATTDSAVTLGNKPIDVFLNSCSIDLVGRGAEIYLDNILSEKKDLPYS